MISCNSKSAIPDADTKHCLIFGYGIGLHTSEHMALLREFDSVAGQPVKPVRSWDQGIFVTMVPVESPVNRFRMASVTRRVAVFPVNLLGQIAFTRTL